MFKETVICIIIVVAIFSLDMFTQNYTNHAVADISDRFSSLRENILKEDKDQMDEELKKLGAVNGDTVRIMDYEFEYVE